MRVLIVEDETTAADNLSYMLRKVDSEIEIVAYAESVEQTVIFLRNHADIDLIFMDIHLSDGSAFSIFDSIDVDVPIVFTTAYNQYALDAFKVNSIDYLLKPIRREELARALAKVRRLTAPERQAYTTAMRALNEDKRYPGRLLLPERDKIIPVAVADICYVYSTNRLTDIMLMDARRFTVTKSLDQLQAQLDPDKFRRANKQFIIAKDAIRELVAWFDSRLLVRMAVDTPEDIYVSKNSAADFKKWLMD